VTASSKTFDNEETKMTTGSTIMVYAHMMDPAILMVVAETDKAVRVQNDYSKKECWLPKAGLRRWKPNDPSYETEYVPALWFRDSLSYQQMQVLNLAE
jgi:hypothetical protein